MQNEITELRNQVRTLKRIVCLVCVFLFLGCASTKKNDDAGKSKTTPEYEFRHDVARENFGLGYKAVYSWMYYDINEVIDVFGEPTKIIVGEKGVKHYRWDVYAPPPLPTYAISNNSWGDWGGMFRMKIENNIVVEIFSSGDSLDYIQAFGTLRNKNAPYKKQKCEKRDCKDKPHHSRHPSPPPSTTP